MNSSILVVGFSTFAASMSFHILLWRHRRPRNDIRALFLVFIVIPAVLFAGAVLMHPGLPQLVHWTAVAILHISLSCAYIQTYPTAQAVSPSLEIMTLVSSRGGLTANEIENHFRNGKLVSSRFEDLLNAGLASESEGEITLTRTGQWFIRGIILYRRILGVEYQGG